MLKIIGCDGFAYGFRFDLIFFAVLRDFFFYGFAVPYSSIELNGPVLKTRQAGGNFA